MRDNRSTKPQLKDRVHNYKNHVSAPNSSNPKGLAENIAKSSQEIKKSPKRVDKRIKKVNRSVKKTGKSIKAVVRLVTRRWRIGNKSRILIVIVFLILAGGWYYTQNRSNRGVLSEQKVAQKPDFDVLSSDTKVDKVQKSALFDSERRIYSFQDQIEGITITVTEQPLPEDIKNDPKGVQKLALSVTGMVSMDRLNTDKGVLYLTQLTNDSQKAILGYGDLLLFFNTTRFISKDLWIDYVNGLR